jgi:hypothetical protein
MGGPPEFKTPEDASRWRWAHTALYRDRRDQCWVCGVGLGDTEDVYCPDDEPDERVRKVHAKLVAEVVENARANGHIA